MIRFIPMGQHRLSWAKSIQQTCGCWNFDLRRSGTSYKDLLTQVIDGTGWEQKTSFMTQSAHGRILGTANKRKTEFDFIDTTMSVSGQLFIHTFLKFTGPNPSGENCPKKYWEMSGSSQTYVANLRIRKLKVLSVLNMIRKGWMFFP